MTDRLNFIFLEMPNCRRALTEKATLLENFCYAMRQMQFLDNRPPQLKSEIFELLFESANISKFTAKEKLKYETDMTTERDRINQLATSFLDGERQGMEKGKAEEKMTTARNFLRLGVSIDVVSKATGLSVEDVKKIK
jgi:predicted transposase/invertase (TIGR01784 family)